LNRLAHRIDIVGVRIESEGTSASTQARYQIDVNLKPHGHLHAVSTGQKFRDTISQTTKKMEHPIRHSIEREQDSIRSRRTKANRTRLAENNPKEEVRD